MCSAHQCADGQRPIRGRATSVVPHATQRVRPHTWGLRLPSDQSKQGVLEFGECDLFRDGTRQVLILSACKTFARRRNAFATVARRQPLPSWWGRADHDQSVHQSPRASMPDCPTPTPNTRVSHCAQQAGQRAIRTLHYCAPQQPGQSCRHPNDAPNQVAFDHPHPQCRDTPPANS